MSRFESTFPRVTLVLFGLMLPILLGATVIVFSVEELKGASNSVSLLPSWLVAHSKAFAIVYVAFAVAAVLASLGMIKKRKWGHRGWVVLTLLEILWTIFFLLSAVVTLFAREGGSSGRLPSYDILAATGAVLPAVAVLSLTMYVLKRLLSSDVKSAFY